MTHGKLPSFSRQFSRTVATAAFAALAMTAISGCASESKSFAPPRGALTNDRALGDILVKFTPPDVMLSEDAGKLLAAIEGPARYVVKRPMSGGVWLITAITTSGDVTMDQAVATLKAAPRIESATPDRMLKPHRARPTGRDMPSDIPAN
ncbi:hypothetical protein [Cupriavidus sp. 2SB]|uniref:hypothetical protein n=1 Tax=Cupriavidus sp. 2SB TaxID=2502199 RepID=UPI0010F70C71|nr:hypothetical protein [Cupriavidus sp. 2SB]